MKKEDKKLWEDDGPVHVTWMDYVYDAIIIAFVCLFLYLIIGITAEGAPHYYGPRAGVNVELQKQFIRAERRAKRLEKKRQQKLEEEKKAKQALEDSYIRVFGYVPDASEIELFKRVVMAECGNTEPDDGILAVSYAIANRVRSGRFPNTITGVVTQRGQFETVSTGRIYNYEVNFRVEEAYKRLLNGERWDDFSSVYFFTAGGYNPYGTQLFVIGNHYFGGLR